MPKNCESKPFIKLQEDNSNAPILNYNMEQENCLNVFANVEVPIKQSLFKPKEVAIPIAYTLKDLEESEIKQILIEELKKNNSAYFGGFGLIQNATLPIIFYEANASSQPYQPVTEALRQSTFPTLPATPLSRPEPLYNNTNGAWSFVVATKGNQSFAKFGKVQVFVDEPVMGRVQNPNDPFGNIGAYIWETRIVGQKDTIEFPQDAVVDFDIMDIVAHIKQGKLPSFVSKSMGKIVIEYTNFNPDTMKDKIISIQYETMLCSYLGNYGAERSARLLQSTITRICGRTSRNPNKFDATVL